MITEKKTKQLRIIFSFFHVNFAIRVNHIQQVECCWFTIYTYSYVDYRKYCEIHENWIRATYIINYSGSDISRERITLWQLVTAPLLLSTVASNCQHPHSRVDFTFTAELRANSTLLMPNLRQCFCETFFCDKWVNCLKKHRQSNRLIYL